MFRRWFNLLCVSRFVVCVLYIMKRLPALWFAFCVSWKGYLLCILCFMRRFNLLCVLRFVVCVLCIMKRLPALYFVYYERLQYLEERRNEERHCDTTAAVWTLPWDYPADFNTFLLCWKEGYKMCYCTKGVMIFVD